MKNYIVNYIDENGLNIEFVNDITNIINKCYDIIKCKHSMYMKKPLFVLNGKVIDFQTIVIIEN